MLLFVVCSDFSSEHNCNTQQENICGEVLSCDYLPIFWQQKFGKLESIQRCIKLQNMMNENVLRFKNIFRNKNHVMEKYDYVKYYVQYFEPQKMNHNALCTLEKTDLFFGTKKVMLYVHWKKPII